MAFPLVSSREGWRGCACARCGTAAAQGSMGPPCSNPAFWQWELRVQGCWLSSSNQSVLLDQQESAQPGTVCSTPVLFHFAAGASWPLCFPMQVPGNFLPCFACSQSIPSVGLSDSMSPHFAASRIPLLLVWILQAPLLLA